MHKVDHKFGGVNKEIICIDDGSTDASWKILNNIKEKYPQIIVERNSTNKGVSYSRNRAMKLAKGRYIWFIDADDMIVPEMVDLFVKTADENNLVWVVGNFLNISSEQTLPISFGEKISYSQK